MVLVIIDGLDASGKSTQGLALDRDLREIGRTVFLQIHPSRDNLFGRKARQFLFQKGKGAHLASAFFYMLDVVRSILVYPWLGYDYIIFVRYLMGTAYLPSPLHEVAYRFFTLTVPTSEFMFFLDVSPEEAERRIRLTRDRFEMFESLEQLRKVRRKALALASLGKWRILNGEKPAKEVEREIFKALKQSF
jgi:dTMP kinase